MGGDEGNRFHIFSVFNVNVERSEVRVEQTTVASVNPSRKLHDLIVGSMHDLQTPTDDKIAAVFAQDSEFYSQAKVQNSSTGVRE